MTDFVTLTCPSCGGKLQITNDLDRFACRFCGNEFAVRRGSGTVSLSPVIESIRSVKTGVDKATVELSVIRLQNEITELQSTGKSFRSKRNNLIRLLLVEIPLFFMLILSMSLSKLLETLTMIIMLVFLVIVITIQSSLSKNLKLVNEEIRDKKNKINKLLKSA